MDSQTIQKLTFIQIELQRFWGFSQFYSPKPFNQFFPGKYHLVFPMVNTTLANPDIRTYLSIEVVSLLYLLQANGLPDSQTFLSSVIS